MLVFKLLFETNTYILLYFYMNWPIRDDVYCITGLKNKEELDYLPNDLTDAIKYNVQCHPSRIPEIADKAKEFYFGTESINKRKHLLEVNMWYLTFFKYIINSNFLNTHTKFSSIIFNFFKRTSRKKYYEILKLP